MKTTTLLALGFAFTLSAAQNSTTTFNTTTTACVPAGAVHMIVARASTEMPGEGIIGAVATTVKSQLPGSDSEAVVYPATLTDYLNSEASGVAAMTVLVEGYAKRCPESKMALLGYSQGAQVAGDVMCGTTETNFNTTAALSAATMKNIVAMVLMGDPSHTPGLVQDVGNSTKAGVFPRLNANSTTGCVAQTAAITKSYCDNDDRFCDSGTSIQVHIGYVPEYGAQAAEFVVGRVNGTIKRRSL